MMGGKKGKGKPMSKATGGSKAPKGKSKKC